MGYSRQGQTHIALQEETAPESPDPLPNAWSTQQEFTIPDVSLVAPERKVGKEVTSSL
jgi:hypothetical protein